MHHAHHRPALEPLVYSRPWRFATSPSKARSASARRGSPSGWPPGSTARPCSKNAENPFLADFYNERPGAALQAQLFFLLNRHRQLTALRQADLFQHTHGLRLPVRPRQDLRLPQPRRQRAVHLPAALRPAGARHPAARSRHLPAGADRRAAARGCDGPPSTSPRRHAAARRRVPARAERGVPALLLPLHRDAAPRRRDVAVRSRRTTTRRSTTWCGRSEPWTDGTRYYVPRTR